MTNLEETILIKRVLKGEVNAYAAFVNQYQHLAITLAFNILLNRHDAEDVAQEAFVKAFVSLENFNGKSRFSTWFYRIVVNTALNKRKIKKLPVIDIREPIGEEPDSFIENNEFLGNDKVKYVHQAIRALSEGERICITLYYLNELSVEEVGSLTSYSISNIKVLLYRARKNIYEELRRILKHEITDLL